MNKTTISNKQNKTYHLAEHKNELATRGWTVLSEKLIDNKIDEILSYFGEIVLQFNGKKKSEITFEPGFEKLPFSQSTNNIGPHTEAPVYSIPPKYLTLYCHKQATCGSGQTLLADGFSFFDSLNLKLKRWAEENYIEISASALPGKNEKELSHTKLMEYKNGNKIFRFSYNQFHFGDVNPSEVDLKNPNVNNSEDLREIAKLGEEFFYENLIEVLIPEKCMLIWDNHRFMHARSKYQDKKRHLTRFWLNEN